MSHYEFLVQETAEAWICFHDVPVVLKDLFNWGVTRIVRDCAEEGSVL